MIRQAEGSFDPLAKFDELLSKAKDESKVGGGPGLTGATMADALDEFEKIDPKMAAHVRKEIKAKYGVSGDELRDGGGGGDAERCDEAAEIGRGREAEQTSGDGRRSAIAKKADGATGGTAGISTEGPTPPPRSDETKSGGGRGGFSQEQAAKFMDMASKDPNYERQYQEAWGAMMKEMREKPDLASFPTMKVTRYSRLFPK